MHLKQLKLAGFKSFVDPTLVHFPSQLVAVVGPNGCGKSNIIDAVRWVMGESSAKNLRGESMTDVIFNGASNRKPLGQASVELLFDNSLGRLLGPFAQYGEIAVKRILTRDGDSSYYLNGARCRRRDITDIFLGTGAGARGYSIIGQGTISRLIEAKPEELRGFLEEAAGVSKYKERRRETLQRIEHTRENLTRVADISNELNKQLQHLERQAKAAERYTVFKQQEQTCRAEIQALKWQDFTQQQLIKQSDLSALALGHEQQQAVLTGFNKEKIILNEQLQDTNEQAQNIQGLFYQLGTEIVRLEETIQQQEREKTRLEQERQLLQEDWQLAAAQVQQDAAGLQQGQTKAQLLAVQLQKIQLEAQQTEGAWQEAQQQQLQWEARWQEVQTVTNTLIRERQIAQVKLEHTEQSRQQTLLRLEKIHLEQAAISVTDLQQVKTDLDSKQVHLQATLDFDEEQLRQAKEQANQLRLQVQATEQQLRQLQDEFHLINSDYAALVAMQRAARQGTQSKSNNLVAWSDKPRLMDVLEVEPKWQLACDLVLGADLHAYVLDSLDELWPCWQACEAQGASTVTLRHAFEQQQKHPSLADQIKGAIPATVSHLETIYTAEHLDEARSWLPNLLDHESVVTANGFWLGKGWARFTHGVEQDELGLLARQQKIADMALIVEDVQQKMTLVRVQRDHYHTQAQQQSQHIELFQLNFTASSDTVRMNRSALTSNEQAIIHAERLMASMVMEAEELQFLLEEAASAHFEISSQLSQLEAQGQGYEQQQSQFVSEKQLWITDLAAQRKQVEELRVLLHQTELEYDRELTKIQQVQDRIVREEERLQLLQQRLAHTALLCTQAATPDTDLKSQLAELIMQHMEVELQLTASRELVAQFRMGLDDLEKKTAINVLELRQIQELISQTQMQEQALAVRASSIHESLEELGLQAQAVLALLPHDSTQSTREDELIAVSEKIKRLGAINLAAIDEFSTEQQRKLYLDEQYNDLSQALTTLEMAIDKMDKETQLRLENTFNEVNTSFQALFPRLFGGGRAQLELTSDNLLEAGIVVMAQPPGKRNSTIHLLSGGEKAMTAVALVFAIFQLNPSPFCMLDEVDAPLDDVNVGRFCALVKEMSQFVQFLFITHNKVTMELADHLIGVTMREPGVSRLVTVDVKQALTME
ncbi:MAG: chromosome segregation protein SMC [Legionellales bacterium]